MELKKNEVYTMTIEDLGSEGEGIGKIDGFTLFVKDAVIGDEIEVKVIKLKKNYGYGRLMKIIKPSEFRTEPLCPNAKACGGCQLQHLKYEKQLEYKQKKVENLLSRVGKITDYEMAPIIGMETPYFYRNKAQFPVGKNKDGQIVTGFYAGRTHSIIDTEKCYIQHPLNETLIHLVKQWMTENNIEPYDETSGRGLVRHILTRIGYVTKEVMVCLVINGDKLPATQTLIDSLKTVEGMTSISININREKTNVILGSKVKTLWGQDYIEDYIGDIKYQISPLSFYQVNPVQTKVLYGKALEFAGLTGNETVWDMYCGIGTISLFLARQAKMVYGVEIVPQAIEDARRNAALNNISNAEFFVGKAEEVVPAAYAERGLRADVVVVDPPRKGCDAALLDCMAQMAPEKIVYVSCDPATLARDLRILEDKGYKTQKVQCVDMFGQSGHVETVVLLSRKTPDDTIEVDLNLDELDATSAETKATYEEIKKYVKEKYQLKVSNLYISQIKRKCGIEVGINYNLPKSENPKVPQCPPEKERAIRDALEHFQMVS